MTFNEKELLNHAGKVSAQIAEKLALERHTEFDKQRKEEERLQADHEDISFLFFLATHFSSAQPRGKAAELNFVASFLPQMSN